MYSWHHTHSLGGRDSAANDTIKSKVTMQITVSVLKANAGRYISILNDEDIFFTKNGKTVAKLVAIKCDKIAAAVFLFDLLPAGTAPDAAKTERFTGSKNSEDGLVNRN